MWSELPDDVLTELRDERFSTRTHGIRATQREGCSGPLCRKAERDHKARLRREEAEREGRSIKDYTPYPVRDLDKVLEVITSWHHEERGYSPRRVEQAI